MYIIPWQQSKESRGNSLTISNDDRFRPRSLKCPGNEKQTPTGLTYLRLCSNRPQANQSRWIPYIHYNRPQTGRRAAFDRSPRARRPLTVKSRPARDLAGRDRNLRMRSALLLRVSSLYRSTQSRNRMSITSKFDPHHSPSHHTTSRSYADCYLKTYSTVPHHPLRPHKHEYSSNHGRRRRRITASCTTLCCRRPRALQDFGDAVEARYRGQAQLS